MRDSEKLREYQRDWYQRNKERLKPQKSKLMQKYREQSRQAKVRLKEKLFEMYGRKCSICGFEDIRALTLDHINGNGNKEKAKLGERGVYRKAAEEYRPDLYRTLCMNCQFIQRSSG